MTSHAYGLDFVSDLPLPHFHGGSAGGGSVSIDFVESTGAIPSSPIGISGTAAGIAIPGWARFEVRGGRHIDIEAAATATREVELFLLGAPLAALLYQRGLLVVRGALVSDGSRAVLLIGMGGTGVSTLVAALLELGWRMPSDGFVALRHDAQGRVSAAPGIPFIKVWRDACDRLARPPGRDTPVRDGSSCHWVCLGPGELILHPVTPTAIVELVMWNRGTLATTLSRVAGLHRLLKCQYHPIYAGAAGRARRFVIATTLAASTPMAQLFRPWRPFEPRAQVAPFLALLDQLGDAGGSET